MSYGRTALGGFPTLLVDVDGALLLRPKTPTPKLQIAPPVNLTRPVIAYAGNHVGQLHACATGLWDALPGDRPNDFFFQWQRGPASISGANTFEYTPVHADIGHRLRCIVTARNDIGFTVAKSKRTPKIKA